MSRAVYLCGFMGCGKTTVGRVLADLLGTAYADMDAYIEKSEKMSIPQIFSDKGEGYFRDAETRAVEEMGKNGGVIACGGGAMLREKNADLAAKNGVVVYIDTPYDICWERIKDDVYMHNPIPALRNCNCTLPVIRNVRPVIRSRRAIRCVLKFSLPSMCAPSIL